MSELPFQFKFKEAGVGMVVDRDDLDKLEQSMYDCWNITTDIKNILKVEEVNLVTYMKALVTVYDMKFKMLSENLDEVDKNLCNLRQTWEEMKPTHPDVMTENLEDEEQLEMFEGESGC